MNKWMKTSNKEKILIESKGQKSSLHKGEEKIKNECLYLVEIYFTSKFNSKPMKILSG